MRGLRCSDRADYRSDDDDELRRCDKCDAVCDFRVQVCECDPAACPYPPVV